jgi:hypothetical protein
VALHSEVPESGWVIVDLTAYEALATFAPQAAGAGSGTPSEPSPAPPDGLDEKAIIKARLVAWAERLRAGETVGRSGRPEASPEAALELGAVAVRRVPQPDIITVDRKAIRRARAPGLRLLAAPARADDVLPAAPLKPGIFRSRRMRLLLLGLAAAYLVTGLAHSFARWKPGRVIVVPSTIDGRTVIT